MLISFRKIDKSFAGIKILDGVDIDICRGDRIGLVGRNGAGKTTIANILASELNADAGTITTSREHISIGYLRQTESYPEVTFNKMIPEQERGEFQRITSHLGLDKVRNWSEERLQNLSGGERTKFALAKVWASKPDLVILDEPTNHMDFEGMKHLISKLENYQGAVIIISHNRYFLDQTVSQIAEIENGIIRIFQGNYSSYREAKQKNYESKQHAYESQQNEQRKIETAINQLQSWSGKAHRESRQKARRTGGSKEYYRAKAKRTDQAVKSQIRRLERMSDEGIERPTKGRRVNFVLQAPKRGGRRLLEADRISKSYGKLLLFTDSSFYINRGEKIGILGPNGCGKTTLIKNILGQETLSAGELSISPTTKIAYVSQELPEEEKHTLKDKIEKWKLEKQKEVFDLLIQLGLTYDRLSVNLEDLSRGERMKIDIALAIMGEYDLLILDEPTNHLDLPSREALEDSLIMFQGTIIIISHDRYLLKRVCDHMLVFDKHKINRIEGNLEDYLAKQSENKGGANIDKAKRDEELLLLENNISRVISELS
ncbi:MAG TPA: ABC-F family ATP-binding cassette domain-containing protein, partial [Syntrophomonadaceae bacterium]|nr:ABC-F family ATP-binding cassette domain-containing protein [Syntrophomonadaceae bacterium]